MLGAVSTALLAVGVAAAQQGDSRLEARLLQRSDGTVYVYKDGTRYSIQPADLSDDDIDAIPLSGAVDRLDQLFAQSPPADAAVPVAPAPVVNAALPEPGTMLYQADWSIGPNGWALPGDWQVAGGLLIDSGTYSGMSVITPPYEPVSPEPMKPGYSRRAWTVRLSPIFQGQPEMC